MSYYDDDDSDDNCGDCSSCSDKCINACPHCKLKKELFRYKDVRLCYDCLANAVIKDSHRK